jgi:hypothetical protein
MVTMKATEYRLGNWVMGNAPYQLGVNALSMHVMYLEQGKQGYFEPILLTEGIMTKSSLVAMRLDAWRIPIGDSDRTFACWFNNKGQLIVNLINEIIILDYLHQLQNLYFALTNRELEISE